MERPAKARRPGDRQTRSSGEQGLYPLGLIFIPAAAILLYWPALRVFFSLDDLKFLMRASGLEGYPDTYSRLLSTRLFFQAGWRVFGASPVYYHLVTLALHTASSYLVYLVARRLRLSRDAGIAGAFLFLMTPVAFTPMHWISGIQEVSMAFFALAAVYLFLVPGMISGAAALVAAALSILCKEASLLALPAAALLLPASKNRKWLLGLGGLAIAAAFLAGSGSLASRPQGDPYETVFGVNIIYNLLTYSAWLARLWDYIPDRIPQYRMALIPWGLVIPAAIAVFMLRRRIYVPAASRGLLMSILLLAPVLPLVRHSYFYYLYLPLVPLWILCGAGLGKLRGGRYSLYILAAFFIYSSLTGTLHRRDQIESGVLTDPFLRYAVIAGRTVSQLEGEGEVRGGDYLFVRNFEGKGIDLSKGLKGRTGSARKKVCFLETALLGGKALRLFFPQVTSAQFEGPSGPVSGWEHMHFFGVHGTSGTVYLGYGKAGRRRLVDDCLKVGLVDRAIREIDIILESYPDDGELRSLRERLTREHAPESQE